MPISHSIRITTHSIYVQGNSWGRPDMGWVVGGGSGRDGRGVGGEWARARVLESLSHVIHVLL